MKTIPERLLANLAASESASFLRLLDSAGGSKTYTYSEVIHLSSAWAHFYLNQGLVAGDRVIIILKHSIELYTTFLGALLVGVIPAMFAFPSPKFSEEEYSKTIGKLLENADAQLLVAYQELKPKLQTYFNTHNGHRKICAPEDLPIVKSDVPKTKSVDPNAIAFLQYSSGTTGLKKGVAISHRALLWQIDHYGEAIKLASDDVIVSWLPLYHDMGLITCFFLPFIKKVRLVAMSPFDWVQKPVMFLQAISDFGGTLCWLPNFAYSFMAKTIPASDLRSINLSLLRGVVNCSEPIMEESHQVFVKRFSALGFSTKALCTSYAMAENTFAVTSGGFDKPLVKDYIDGSEFIKSGRAVAITPGAPDAKIMVSSGLALPETSIEIISDTGAKLPERQVGEIVLQSPCLLSEYYRNPEETGKSIHNSKYFTGDLGYLANGELFVTGRKKDMIIIGGQNIYPQDIEFIVNTVSGIIPGRNVALGIPDSFSGTEKLVVLAETNENHPEHLERIRKEIYDKITTRTEVIASDIRLYKYKWLIKSTSGKIARLANLERYLGEVAKEQTNHSQREISNYLHSNDELKVIVRRCVTRQLAESSTSQHYQINDDTPIITSGLIDSFHLARLIVVLEEDCGITIPSVVFSDIGNFDTIENIAGTIKRLKDNVDNFKPLPEPPFSPSDILMEIPTERRIRSATGLWTWYYRWLFLRKGIRYGRGLRVYGPLILRLDDGDPRNISIGDNVTLMPMVDLKIRDNGKIILHTGVILDTMVRLVSANNAKLELGEDVGVSMGTIINAGADVLIGRRTAIAGFCTIIASEHKYNSREPIMSQGYNRNPVYIGEDVWLAANVFIGRGSRIGNGAVIGAKSLISGDIPAYALVAGNPGRVVKFRY